jgi:TetR/AcrR family fatty acid metabolism transcriptional regulator
MTARETKRNRIIRAAAAVFSQKGYTGALMAEVAVEAGVGKGTVYEYFSSKAELFLAVFDWLHQQISEAVLMAADRRGGSAADRMRARVEAVVKSALEVWDFYGLFMEFWTASAGEQFRSRLGAWIKAAYAEHRRLVADLIREGVERGEFRPEVDPEAMAVLAVGSLEGIFLQAWFDDRLDPAEMARRHVDFFIDGLMCRAGDAK